ncbi:hypothetical protein HDU76_005077 [Blyttiomyces sp. JEL0837]|nr:hypothetical protein HDU76_005077 [Blyttiomyces sp. JEL0837]
MTKRTNLITKIEKVETSIMDLIDKLHSFRPAYITGRQTQRDLMTNQEYVQWTEKRDDGGYGRFNDREKAQFREFDVRFHQATYDIHAYTNMLREMMEYSNMKDGWVRELKKLEVGSGSVKGKEVDVVAGSAKIDAGNEKMDILKRELNDIVDGMKDDNEDEWQMEAAAKRRRIH